MSQPLRIGTRGSPLALAQAHMVAAALRASAGVETEIVPITTTGDLIQDRALAEVGGKALWTKELDRALADGRTDLSVHSMKDVETLRPASLLIAAMLERADTRDRLIGANSLAALPEGARVGTASPRRTAQLLARRPDLRCAIIRGNVQTRLAKIAAGEYDATLLAAAGLDRLGLALGAPLDLLPAPAQGAIGVEILADRSDLATLLAAIDHRPTHEAVSAERAFLAALGGDCHSAVAALATGGVVNAEILSADGSEIRSGEGEPEALARSLLAEASPSLRALFGK
jgi:hydroxymethylbilane synthase